MKKNILTVLLSCAVLTFGGCMETPECLKGKEGLFAVMDTTRGQIVLELYPEKTPLTVANFVGLAEGKLDATKGKKFYNGLKFHRVVENFMIQGGDPKGNGTGGPGYQFADECLEELQFTGPGVLAMANAGAGTNGSQFFITHVETPWLNGKHTIFGHVVDDNSQKVVNAIKQNDKINSVTIIRLGEKAKSYQVTQKMWNELAENAGKEAAAKQKEAMKAQLAQMRVQWDAYVENLRNEYNSKKSGFSAKISEIENKFKGYSQDENGIYFKTTKEGNGEKAGYGANVSTHYKGYFVDGKVFDSSEGREPLDFMTGIGRMIIGYDLMTQDMKKSEKRTVILPPQFAYGEQGIPGAIEPNSFLVFDIELVDVQ